MIKINRDTSFWKALEDSHYSNLIAKPYNIQDKIDQFINGARGKGLYHELRLYRRLKNNLKDILLGHPSKIEEHISFIQECLDGIKHRIICGYKMESWSSEYNRIIANLNDIFDYDKFARNYMGYGAYALVKKLNVNTCPYCNRQHTVIFHTSEGKTRAKLDHWLDKASYPYLSLSLYNLIPCCTVCNSDLKNITKFNFTSHIHPYLEGFENSFVFKTNITAADYKVGGLNSFELDLHPSVRVDESDPYIIRVRNNIRTFCLTELYNCHKEVAGKVIEYIDETSEEHVDGLLTLKSKSGIPLFKSREDVLKRAFGIMHSKHFEKEAFSKLKRDISYEQGLPIQLI